MTDAPPLKILVLAHDLSDAAIARRVTMLRSGGAVVSVAGFRRTPEPIASVAGCAAVDLGRTHNAGFIRRIGSVLGAVVRLGRYRTLFAGADVILARNLEMLALGVRGRRMCAPPPVLVYEMLDVHRLLLDRGPIGGALRALEGWLSRRASAVFTSSPAYSEGYFNKLSRVRLPIRLVENKALDAGERAALVARKPGPPWVIGWFGIIRCRQSLQILGDLARQGDGAIEVVIRGRPAPDQFADFAALTAGMPHLRFQGPYKNPGDLASIYREAHFSWAIDRFEQGLNSSWLLPNRLYEGALYGAVSLAEDAVETGRFLKRLGIGVTLGEPLDVSLAAFFKTLTTYKYRALEDAVLKIPQATWICTTDDCKALVDYMRSLREAAHG